MAELEIRTIQIVASSRKARESLAEKGKRVRSDGTGFVPTYKAMKLKWNLLLDQYFPDEPRIVWPVPLNSAICKYAAAWTEARKSGEFYDYLEFVFSHWLQLRTGALRWMSGCPAFPLAEIFVSAKLRNIFEVAYSEKERWERWKTYDRFHYLVAELVDKGIDREVAMAQIQQEFGFEDQKKVLKKMQEEIVFLTDRMRQKADGIAASVGKRLKRKSMSEMKITEFTWEERDG